MLQQMTKHGVFHENFRDVLRVFRRNLGAQNAAAAVQIHAFHCLQCVDFANVAIFRDAHRHDVFDRDSAHVSSALIDEEMEFGFVFVGFDYHFCFDDDLRFREQATRLSSSSKHFHLIFLVKMPDE